MCTPHVNSITPLNATGFLVSGTCDGDSKVGEEVYLGALDAGGKSLWGHAFGITPVAGVDSGAEGRAAVRLTDDGGALVTAYADEGEDTGQTRLLVAKLFAKDGKASAKGAFEVQADPTFASGQCALTPGSTKFAPVDSAATTKDLTAGVHVEPITFTKTDYLP